MYKLHMLGRLWPVQSLQIPSAVSAPLVLWRTPRRLRALGTAACGCAPRKATSGNLGSQSGIKRGVQTLWKAHRRCRGKMDRVWGSATFFPWSLRPPCRKHVRVVWAKWSLGSATSFPGLRVMVQARYCLLGSIVRLMMRMISRFCVVASQASLVVCHVLLGKSRT